MTDPITLSRQQVRDVDRRAIEQYGIPGIVLMENAGRGVVDVMQRLGVRGPVVVCCGKGNNAGDGLVIARHLELRQIDVRVLLWADPKQLRGDAAVNFRILQKTDVPLVVFGPECNAADLDLELRGAEWIVDALLGTGARGEPREPLGMVIDTINAQQATRLAVDLPSGLDCDTGQAAAHTIRAAHTCTLVAEKPGFHTPGAERFTGQIHLLDIGAPRKLIEEVRAGDSTR